LSLGSRPSCTIIRIRFTVVPRSASTSDRSRCSCSRAAATFAASGSAIDDAAATFARRVVASFAALRAGTGLRTPAGSVFGSGTADVCANAGDDVASATHSAAGRNGVNLIEVSSSSGAAGLDRRLVRLFGGSHVRWRSR
jgi:hypothetical protein